MNDSICAGLLISLLLAAEPAAAANVRVKIVHATAKRAYFKAGAARGVTLGDKLAVVSRGKTVGTCMVDHVADKSASCVGAELAEGMEIALPDRAPVQKARSTDELPQPLSATAIDTAHTAFAQASMDKVEFSGKSARRVGWEGVFGATISHQSWATFDGNSFQQERIDLAVEGLDLRFGGFRAFAHASMFFWTQRPTNTLFRPGDNFQFYLWDLQAVSRELGRPYAASIGRFWPEHAPGLSVLDGAQAGWRSKDGSLEVGLLGGLVPGALTLYPTNSWLVGAYYAHQSTGNGILRIFRDEARLGIRASSQLGAQLELEALVRAWLGKNIDLAAQLRATLGAGQWGRPVLESFRLTAGLTPITGLRLGASVRYNGWFVPDYDAIGLSTSARMYATGDASWTPTRWLNLSLTGGATYEFASFIQRYYVGPDVSFPVLFGPVGGLGIGYREEFGYLAGRTAYVNFFTGPSSKLRFLARLSYIEDSASGLAQRDLGGYASADWQMMRWLALRASLMARGGIDSTLLAPTTPRMSLTARLDLAGEFP